MPKKIPPQPVSKEYIQLLESRLLAWQGSLALVRKLMKSTDNDIIMVEHKKTGELGIEYLDKYVQKVQTAAYEGNWGE